MQLQSLFTYTILCLLIGLITLYTLATIRPTERTTLVSAPAVQRQPRPAPIEPAPALESPPGPLPFTVPGPTPGAPQEPTPNKAPTDTQVTQAALPATEFNTPTLPGRRSYAVPQVPHTRQVTRSIVHTETKPSQPTVTATKADLATAVMSCYSADTPSLREAMRCIAGVNACINRGVECVWRRLDQSNE